MLIIVKNILFYRLFGRNHPIVLNDDNDGTVHRGTFQLIRDRQIFNEGPRCSRLIGVINTLESRSLDHDRAVQMRSVPFHLDCYNASLISTCSLIDRWSALHPINA